MKQYRKESLCTVLHYRFKILCTEEYGGLNFRRTFISSFPLVLELAGSNLVRTLLEPLQILKHYSILLSGSTVFANEEKGS